MSAGVCIRSSSGCINATERAVSTADTATVSTDAVKTERLSPFISPAPNFCAVRRVNPVVMPEAKPVIRNMIVPVLPTAASAPVPTNCPTMIVSAIL